jgi:hypothetical protein
MLGPRMFCSAVIRKEMPVLRVMEKHYQQALVVFVFDSVWSFWKPRRRLRERTSEPHCLGQAPDIRYALNNGFSA